MSNISYWKNTSPDPVKVSLFVGVGSPHVREEWEPGETKGLPSTFDSAFEPQDAKQKYTGLAPQLKRVDSMSSAPSKEEPRETPRRPAPAPDKRPVPST